MDLSHIWRLRHFLAVLEDGSFQAAGRRINVSQPALTKSIRLLEEEFATPLFLRRARGVIPTDEGRKLELNARRIVEEWSQAKTEIGAHAHGEGGEFSIGAGPVFAAVYLPQLLADLHRLFPRLRMTVMIGSTSDLLPELNRGRIRVYIGGVASELDANQGRRFETHILGEQSNSLYAAMDHPIHTTKKSPALLLDYPWLDLFNARIDRERLTTFFAKSGLQPPTFALKSLSLHIATKMLLEHRFLACLPKPLLEVLPPDQLKKVVIPGFDWSIRTGLTFNESSATYPPLIAAHRILKSLVSTP